MAWSIIGHDKEHGTARAYTSVEGEGSEDFRRAGETSSREHSRRGGSKDTEAGRGKPAKARDYQVTGDTCLIFTAWHTHPGAALGSCS